MVGLERAFAFWLFWKAGVYYLYRRERVPGVRRRWHLYPAPGIHRTDGDGWLRLDV
jgi:hypothetical protein